MPIEHSAGSIIFRKDKEGKRYYLLLNYPTRARSKSEYWDLPKGHIEQGESSLDTVKREVFEETGISGINFVEGFKETIKYFFRVEEKNIFKTVVFYLAETKKEKIVISEEHKGFKWLPFKEALNQLTFKNAKDVLKKAEKYLSDKGL